MLIAESCDPFATATACSSTPTFDQYYAEIAKAIGNVFGAFFHGGPPLVLGGLLVLWALSRVLAWASVLFLGRSKKGEL